MLGVVVTLAICLGSAWAYRTGAPTRACGDMTPQHGSPINTDPAPYLVEVSKTQYSPNERIYGELYQLCCQSQSFLFLPSCSTSRPLSSDVIFGSRFWQCFKGIKVLASVSVFYTSNNCFVSLRQILFLLIICVFISFV